MHSELSDTFFIVVDVNQNLSAPAEVSRAIFGASAKFSVGGSVESDHSEPILHVNVYAVSY